MTSSVTIVTGASQGVGRLLAIGFAREGFKVVAMARSAEKLASLAAEAGVPSESILALPVDLSQPDSIGAALRSIPAEFDNLEVVVNNAGEGELEPSTCE